ncbi:hybrid sensor histidine kinase/response regulator [Desulfopila aestuarii]|uniref:histidine kinase n=1 Tax=Desulfopila aestuarii DSM 18488 TaxID=1121416 RepID=A0A1M7XWP8_9BACT|nr:PAS domain-containing hybrid sensor histidine kinase/response regulator [Desulfopila aestuarii]SHO43229.1 PAS domain S-box-containing protein [Desulfopila aestuarii DSM 18488]
MNFKALEIQIYFEIAMAIGNSLDLQKMLQTALSAYLRKLSCATGMVLELQLQNGCYNYVPCFAIPRNTNKNPVYTSILGQLPTAFNHEELDSFQNTLPLSGSIDDRHHFHITLLPDFGLLLLIRSSQPLEARTLFSLKQLNKKLADSCIACLQKEKIEAMNQQLSHEIHQRKGAELQLKELLGNLEQKVSQRTKALRESETRYRAIFDNIQDIFFSLSPEGRILEISPSVKTTLQYPRSRLIGRSLRFLGFRQKDIDHLSHQLETYGNVKDFQISMHARDGVRHYFSMNAILTMGSGSNLFQIVGSLRDITQQHDIEQSKKVLEEQLQNSRKMEALGLLAGGVAHDLNNVLSGIVSYPDLLLTMIDDKSPLRRPIATIRESGEKAAAIVQDLLNMARRGVVQKETINLNPLVAEYLKSPEHERLIGSHDGITIITKLQPDLLNLKGSALHLKNALMNLVLNSVEAGADRIIVTTENTCLEGKTFTDNKIPEGEYVILQVSDNGSGISEEDQQRIFEPFYTKKVMGKSGTGLGMAVVWGTVQDHGGHITIDSKPGSPTTFRLIFPSSRDSLVKQETIEPHREILGKGESVLIVDDSEQQRQIAQATLAALNYRVHLAASGEEALLFLQHSSSFPDIVILDMIMEPGIDGLDTYRLIRDLYPEQKVIIASGYSETVRVREALRLGALMYIKKPYLLKTIGTALRQCLEPTEAA